MTNFAPTNLKKNDNKMVMKTRERLIDVARQLFANQGVDKTTMNDIANASDKGRRTIYTYFKNKREIYNAVLERESETMIASLREVASAEMPPAQKLATFIERRIELGATDMLRQSSIRSLLTFDYRRAVRLRQMAAVKESEMLDSILAEGIVTGDFDQEQSRLLPPILAAAIDGIDSQIQHSIQEGGTADVASTARDLARFIVASIAASR